jgi:hypothetical protein
VRESLCDGHEHAVTLETFVLGIQVRAEHGHETYVAIPGEQVFSNLTDPIEAAKLLDD